MINGESAAVCGYLLTVPWAVFATRQLDMAQLAVTISTVVRVGADVDFDTDLMRLATGGTAKCADLIYRVSDWWSLSTCSVPTMGLGTSTSPRWGLTGRWV